MFELERFGDRACLIGEGQRVTYAEVAAQVLRFRGLMAARSLVLCLCENTVPAIMGYVALVANGHVPLLLDAGQSSDQVLELCELYGPSFAWLPERRVGDHRHALEVMRIGAYVLVQLDRARHSPLHPELQLLLTTSGSTGSKKLVRLSRRNLESNASAIASYLCISDADIAVTTLPFSYSFGLSILNSHLSVGASVLATELTPLQREFWDLVQKKGVTSISGVPYTFQMLKRVRFERRDLPSIRYVTQAGGKPGDEVLDYLQRLSAEGGLPCFLMYGQTEATARISYLPPELLASKSGSIGVPIPGGHLELIDADGAEIPEPRVVGQLVFTGPGVAMGYATECQDLGRGDDWGGRLETGDLAFRDEEGFFYIAGRQKRFVKLFGRRVSLDEVETLLAREFPGCEFACHGSDDALHVSSVGVPDLQGVIRFVSARLGVNRAAVICAALDELPRLASGKVDYPTLNRMAAAG